MRKGGGCSPPRNCHRRRGAIGVDLNVDHLARKPKVLACAGPTEQSRRLETRCTDGKHGEQEAVLEGESRKYAAVQATAGVSATVIPFDVDQAAASSVIAGGESGGLRPIRVAHQAPRRSRLGKMPTTSVRRRLISRFSRSCGLLDHSFCQWARRPCRPGCRVRQQFGHLGKGLPELFHHSVQFGGRQLLVDGAGVGHVEITTDRRVEPSALI